MDLLASGDTQGMSQAQTNYAQLVMDLLASGDTQGMSQAQTNYKLPSLFIK